ncbi:MAG TPA: hypothetical protein ENJ91_03380 [Rhodobacteraceae bacterium]|nr:hypothetical protein [Paracoccaceae bacterium]
MQKKLARLQNLTNMALDVSLMRLKYIQSQEQDLSNRIRQMEEARRDRTKALYETGFADDACRAGADNLWESWLQNRTRELNIRRAELRSLQDEVFEETQKAFSKNQAVEKLAAHTTEQERIRRQR